MWLLVVGVGCGGEDPKGECDRDGEAPPFDCRGSDTGTCDPETEFCLESWLGDSALAGTCVPKFDGCGRCDCLLEEDIEQVWFDAMGETDNCSGALLYCEQSNAQILVVCQK